jgi:choline dehydrogenase-like flavoprotein
MLIDLDQEVAGRSFRSDVCVLGAGIAGLVLAHKLAARGVKVHLLEGGGLEPEPRSQALFDAEIAGDRYTGASDGRSRVFGGTSTQWGGQLLPYTGDVFSPHPGMPSHPWPISAAEIEPYSSEVLEIMGVNALPFDSDLLAALGRPPVKLNEEIRLRFSKWAPFTRRNLANSLGRQCIAHPNVTVFTHANAMSVALDDSSERAASVTAKNYAGVTYTFVADHFCVCLGTIESSRLLLASTGPNGIAVGNHFDQIGRYFHDHLSLRAAVFGGPARDRLLRKLGPFYVEGTSHTCKLEASDELRIRMGLPAAMAHIVIDEPPHSGVAAVRNLLKSVQQGKLSEAIQSNIVAAMHGILDIASLLWQSRIHRRRAVNRRARVYLNIDLEQVPRADDRIRLSETRDALGQRKPIVEWRIDQQECDTARRFAQIVRAELERLHLAPLAWMTGVLEAGPLPTAMSDTFHPMGGLRMGNHPQSSVVDPNLKLHGVANLHIASCAVFPGGGSSNPTFTLMALTLRLADRLTGLLQK